MAPGIAREGSEPTGEVSLYIVEAPSAACPQLALPPARRSRPRTPHHLSPPVHPHPPNPALIYAFAERAKPIVLHAGVGRISKGEALLFDSTELDGGRGPSSSVAVARSLPLLACMNQHFSSRTLTGCAAYTKHKAPATHTGLLEHMARTFPSREKAGEPREECDAAEDAEDDAHPCMVWLDRTQLGRTQLNRTRHNMRTQLNSRRGDQLLILQWGVNQRNKRSHRMLL